MPKWKKPLIERFLEKVNKTEDCWIWIGAYTKNGYGAFWNGVQLTGAHQFSYTQFVGSIPQRICVCHHCDNPGCVNPEHLVLGTQRDNMRDMHSKGRGRSVETYSRGNEHCNAKLSVEDVCTIRQLYKPGLVSMKQLGEEFGVDLTTVRRAIRKVTYQNVQQA